MKAFQWTSKHSQRTGTRPTLRLTAAIMAAAAVSFAALSGEAQTLADGGLNGQMVTRAARVNGGSDFTFLTVPPGHFFILTQACFTTGTGSNLRFEGVGLDGGNQGGTLIEPQATLDSTDCKQFTPGLVYQPGDAVLFRNNGVALQRVYINGVMLNNSDHHRD